MAKNSVATIAGTRSPTVVTVPAVQSITHGSSYKHSQEVIAAGEKAFKSQEDWYKAITRLRDDHVRLVYTDGSICDLDLYDSAFKAVGGSQNPYFITALKNPRLANRYWNYLLVVYAASRLHLMTEAEGQEPQISEKRRDMRSC